MSEERKVPDTQKSSVDKGKSLANIVSSSANLLSDISRGTSGVEMELSGLMSRIDNASKGGSSFTPAASVARMKEYAEVVKHSELPSHSSKVGFRGPQTVEDLEWVLWENSIDNFENNFIGVPDYHYRQGAADLEQKDDGDEVRRFLNLNFYTSEIYDPADHHKELSSRMLLESAAVNDFLDAPDIVTYLKQTRYTHDVYGLPVFLRNFIKEAKDEIVSGKDSTSESGHHKTAIERLTMVRDHLIRMKESREKEHIMERAWNDF
ncbi:3524_t:CDS:1 [Acaulospora colombiana]|uniref:3524_t:CDS:1 n=1 Tax=Acaulospora colombiana TaxID=27376 RepID=A0ACA9K2N1_9GLOM|nr:3524_t:CDS:1 [Acaulospora colombiana]